MKITILSLISLYMLAVSSVADGTGKTYWYQIAVARGNTNNTFYGSSTMDPAGLSAGLTASQPIILENLRDTFALAGEDKMKMRPRSDYVKVVLPATSVLYIIQLDGDPAAAGK